MRIQPIGNYASQINFNGRIISRPNYSSKGDTYDSFTGLKDKTALLTDVGRRMYRKEGISIGMFDLDNFKSVNELLGYKVGDEFIKAISEDISTVAEKHGIDSYRFGGDEFVVLLFQDTSRDEKVEIVEEILEGISENPVVQGKNDEYKESAYRLLDTYEESNNKVKRLVDINVRYNTLNEIWDNSTVAREDPYIINEIVRVGAERRDAYSELLEESIETEQDNKQRKILESYRNRIDSKQEDIDEYLFGRYDKNHEIYRLKKWLRDFNMNGFSLTGGIVNFKSTSYKGKQPIDLINEVGEFLKQGKANSKGSYYITEVE